MIMHKGSSSDSDSLMEMQNNKSNTGRMESFLLPTQEDSSTASNKTDEKNEKNHIID
mgnify:CR=1 FL=1